MIMLDASSARITLLYTQSLMNYLAESKLKSLEDKLMKNLASPSPYACAF